MAITKSAKKAIRSHARKRVINIRRMDTMRGAIKEVKKLINEKKTDEAKTLMSRVYKAIDKAAKRGVIKKNNASRKKMRLMKFVNKTS